MSSKRKKNPLERDQALNDATNGQLGELPRPSGREPSKQQSARVDDNHK
jgi:hypothetical protein